jgi:CRP/FNR family transcriptional regulator, nitrogen oxide reductase regulator
VATNFVRPFATEIPLVENPTRQLLSIKSRQSARRSQNGRMDRAGSHDQSAGMPRKLADTALDFRIACIRTAPLFCGLPQWESYEIAHAAQELHFLHRETIFRQDDPVRFVYVVAAGTVKMTQLSEGGKEVILRVDRRGSLIDDLTGALQVHASSAHAIHSCGLLAWDVAAFEDFAERFPVIHRNATSIMLGRLRMLEERFCDVTTQRVPQRLARLLIHLAGQSMPGALATIHLSREELSQMTGTSLFTVSRLLSLWAESDILTVDRKAVVIEDLPRLLRIAQAGAA